MLKFSWQFSHHASYPGSKFTVKPEIESFVALDPVLMSPAEEVIYDHVTVRACFNLTNGVQIKNANRPIFQKSRLENR